MVAVQSLAEMAARKTARCYSFDALEAAYHSISAERRRSTIRGEYDSSERTPSLFIDTAFTDHAAIPDKFFLSIVRWCFPENEEDIRLYRCVVSQSLLTFSFNGSVAQNVDKLVFVFFDAFKADGIMN